MWSRNVPFQLIGGLVVVLFSTSPAAAQQAGGPDERPAPSIRLSPRGPHTGDIASELFTEAAAGAPSSQAGAQASTSPLVLERLSMSVGVGIVYAGGPGRYKDLSSDVAFPLGKLISPAVGVRLNYFRGPRGAMGAGVHVMRWKGSQSAHDSSPGFSASFGQLVQDKVLSERDVAFDIDLMDLTFRRRSADIIVGLFGITFHSIDGSIMLDRNQQNRFPFTSISEHTVTNYAGPNKGITWSFSYEPRISAHVSAAVSARFSVAPSGGDNFSGSTTSGNVTTIFVTPGVDKSFTWSIVEFGLHFR